VLHSQRTSFFLVSLSWYLAKSTNYKFHLLLIFYGGFLFESRLGHRLRWVRIFMVFFRSSWKIPG
jgi:hypothetical protein